MAITVTRLQSDGTLLLNGEFDEFTNGIVTSNLVLWLDATTSASYPESGNTWFDLSNNDLDGTLVNGPTYDSQGWITFDRTLNQRVDFADNANVDFTGTASYSLEAWVYPTSNPATLIYQGILNHESNPGGGRDGWNLWLSGNSSVNSNMTFATERFALGSQSVSSVTLNSNVVVANWQHIAATYDGSRLRLYRNGSLVSNVSSTISMTNTTVTLTAASRGSGSYLSARLPVLRIYDTALTDNQVMQNYQADAAIYIANASVFTSVTSNSVLAAQFDEITFNASIPAISRVDSSGTQYVSGIFDEFTGAPVINSNLLIWLDAGQTTSYAGTGTTWTDLSGLGNNGTLVGGTGYDPRDGGALTFDGTDDYVSFAANPSLTNQITVEAYVDLDLPLVQTNGWILGREGSYRLIYNNGQFQWVCATVNNGWYTTGTAISASYATTSGIYQVVGTYDGSNLRLYVNGALVATGSAISGNILTSGTYWVGRSGAVNVDYTRGRIFLHRLYSVALTTDEVSQNFNANRRRYGI